MRESCKYGSVRGAGSNPRPYRNRLKCIRPKGGTNRDICCIPPPRNQDAANTRNVVTSIKSEPPAANEDLKPRAEIHWCGIGGHPDVPQIAGAVPGGNVQAAAQSDGEVGKIATDAALLSKCLLRSSGRTGMLVTECDVAMNEITNCLHSPPTQRCVTKQSPSPIRH
jgi:hypothetical protein